MKKRIISVIALILTLVISLTSCLEGIIPPFDDGEDKSYLLEDVPEFNGKDAYVIINKGKPFFTEEEITTEAYESYAELDALGRCGVTVACIGRELMPDEERGSIGQVKPTGWHTVKYDIVDGKYLYNRCHLIGFQLTGENANRQNLITGTRFLNIEGMLVFENMVADYIKETGNHVMYRVTPIFKDRNLLASGVLMEAYSVEDSGAGIEFCVYSYNAQPGITIDYFNGNSAISGETLPDVPVDDSDDTTESGETMTYILNEKSQKFHLPTCSGVSSMSEANKREYTGTRGDLLLEGYSPCGTCKP